MVDLLVGILATWRLSNMLTDPTEIGPFDFLEKIRDFAGIYYDEHSECQGPAIGKALCCIWCTSVWVGLVFAKGNPIKALAYSAGAILFNKVVKDG